MAMATKRSKALHNFTMPGDLRWGNQKFLRCMKVNSNGQIPAPVDGSNRVNSDPAGQRRVAACELPERKSPTQASPASSGSRQLKVELGGSDGGIAAVREKVMLDLQTAADKMRESIFKEGLEGGETTVRPPTPPPPPPPPLPVEGEAVRPWNLRTRRAPVKFPAGVGDWCVGAAAEGDGGMGHDALFAQTRTTASVLRNPPATASGGDEGPGTSGKKRERPEISVRLSKREIEEDFFSFVGHRPPRRPKKRHRAVQKHMDTLFPGLWLTEVTPDMYKVPDEEKKS